MATSTEIRRKQHPELVALITSIAGATELLKLAIDRLNKSTCKFHEATPHGEDSEEMLASIGTRTEATQKAPGFRRLSDLCLELTERVNENTALRSRAGFKRGIIASSHSDARRKLGKRDAGRVRDRQCTVCIFSRRSTIVEAKRF